MKALSLALAVNRLRDAVKAAGGQLAYAAQHRIDRSYLNNVLCEQRPLTDKIAKTIGLKRLSVFVEIEDQTK